SLDRSGALPDAALRRLADLYRYQDRSADFLRVAERLLPRRPDDAALRDAAAESAEALGRPQDAFRLLQPLAERRPLDAGFALRYPGLAAQVGRLDDGLRIHRRFAAAAGPGYRLPDYRLKVGRLLTDLGRYPEAIAEYQAVLEASGAGDAPESVQARLALA